MVLIAFLHLVSALKMALPAQTYGHASRESFYGLRLLELKGNRLTEPNLFSSPMLFAVVGRYLVVLDVEADSIGVVLDHLSGRVLARFGGQRGPVLPTSLGAPVSIDAFEGNKFLIVDEGARRLSEFSLSENSAGVVTVSLNSVRMFPEDVPRPIISGFLAHDSTLVCSGFFGDSRFGRIAGNAWSTFGPPPPGDASTTPAQRQRSYQTFVVPHPDRKRFVAGAHLSAVLDVFAIDGVLISRIETRPAFKTIPRGQVWAAETRDLYYKVRRYGYVSIAAADSGFYALYSGRTSLETSGRAASGSILEYFDWDGNRKHSFSLDSDVSVIATERNGTTIFGITRGAVPGVVRFSVPPTSAPATKKRIS